MEKYSNRGNDSGVASFDIGEDYIVVKFIGTIKPYKYSYRKAGEKHVEKMKQLARSGSGLNSYINSHVKFKYD